jgi:hypothetical protein
VVSGSATAGRRSMTSCHDGRGSDSRASDSTSCCGATNGSSWYGAAQAYDGVQVPAVVVVVAAEVPLEIALHRPGLSISLYHLLDNGGEGGGTESDGSVGWWG